MTTVQDLRDIVYFKYMKEAKRRGEPEVEMGDGEFMVYYDMVRSEVNRELNTLRLVQDITLTAVTVYTEYALASTFGGLVSHEIYFSSETFARNLVLKDISEVPTEGNLTSGTPQSISIFNKNDGLSYVYLYPLTNSSGTLSVRYKANTEIDDPIGAGDGTQLTKTINMPIQYHHLLIHGVMGHLFPDLLPFYYTQLNEAKFHREIPTKGQTDYSLGGLDDEEYDDGQSKNFRGEY